MTDTRRDPVPGRDPAADREPHEDRRDEAAREHGQGDQRVFHDAHRTGLYLALYRERWGISLTTTPEFKETTC